MEAHMNFSFLGAIEELRSVDAVLLEKNTAVWHSTHPCKQITAYTVVTSINFLPLFFFLFKHRRYFKKYSDRNKS